MNIIDKIEPKTRMTMYRRMSKNGKMKNEEKITRNVQFPIPTALNILLGKILVVHQQLNISIYKYNFELYFSYFC